MPLLRNSLIIVLFIASSFCFIRLNQPLSFSFNSSHSKLQFIQPENLNSIGVLPLSIELYDTAPLFIPTKWNYCTHVIPDNKNFNPGNFLTFEPLVKLDEFFNVTNLDNSKYEDFDILALDLEFDLIEPRLLTSWMAENSGDFIVDKASKKEHTVYRSQYKVDILKKGSDTSETEIFYEYELSDRPALNSLKPIVLLFNNESIFSGNPTIYESSFSADFDEAILEWFKNPNHLAHLPKGYLMLTFYPY